MAERFDVLNFLEEYQRFPCLWKKKCADFKNRVKRDHAEEVLLPVSGLTTIKELRQKIRNIRCTYNQEVAKIKKTMGTGTGTDYVYYPKLAWFAFADSFLRQNAEENDSESNLVIRDTSSQETPEEPASIENTEIPQELARSMLQPQDSTIRTTKVSSDVTSQTPQKRIIATTRRPERKTKKSKLDDSLDNAVEVLKNVANQSTAITVNEFTVFGQHIASQLQCLPLEEALKLQEDIQRRITSARLRSVGASRSTATPSSQISFSRPNSRDTYTSDTPYSDRPLSPEVETQPSYYELDNNKGLKEKINSFYSVSF